MKKPLQIALTVLQRWFVPPAFADEDTTHRASLLNSILFAVLLALLLGIVGNLVVSAKLLTIYGILVGGLILLLGLRYVMRQGQVTWASRGLIVISGIVVTGLAVALGTIRAPNTSIYVLLIILSGLLLNRRAMVLTTVLCSLAVLGLVWAESAGWLPSADYRATIVQSTTFTLVFALTAVCMHLALQSIAEALARVRQQVAERQKAESERNRMEEVLHISLEKYRVLFESLPLGITVSDSDGHILEGNQESERLLGISREEQTRRRIDGAEWRIIRPDGTLMPPGEYASVRALQENRRVENVEMGIAKPDEDATWLSVTAAPIPLPGYGVVVTYGDITDHKRAEQAARDTEQQFRTFAEWISDGIVLTNEQGIVTEWNQAAERIMGVKRSEAIGRPIWEIQAAFAPEERRDPALCEQLKATLQDFLRTGQAPWLSRLQETELKLPDGTRRSVQAVVSAIPTARGYRAGSVIRDVTELVQAREALEREMEINTTLANLSSALLSPAPPGDISDLVLEQAKRLTGSPHGVAGYVDPQTGHFVATTLSGDAWERCQVANKDTAFARCGGLWGWVLDNQEPLLTNDPADDPRWSGTPSGHIPIRRFLSVPALIDEKVVGQISLANADHDYTERDVQLVQRLAAKYAISLQRYWSENALQQRTAELQARNEELDAYAHTVAHDLRNPLSLITGYAEVLADDYETLSRAELQRHLSTIARVGRKMNNIVEELLLLAGLRRIDVTMEPLDMAHIVAEAEQRVADMAREYQAEISAPTASAWPAVLGYAPWVEEVWVNYLSNAIKYGGRPPHVELGATVQEGGMVCFWVRDDGKGLTLEQQSMLFKPFTRLSQTQTDGQGLGLSIARRIVERLGGQVGVKSEGVPGKGSVFSFTLPGVRAGKAGDGTTDNA